MSTEPLATHGVVLSGGGALGAFELGVLRVLAGDTTQPDPVIFTGTSVGGFNAAVLAAEFTADRRFRQAVDVLIDIWRKRVAGGLEDNGVFRLRWYEPRLLRGSPDAAVELLRDMAYMSLDLARRMASLAASPSLQRLTEMVDVASLISTEPLRRLVRDSVSWERLRSSPRVLRIAATNWVGGKLQLFVHDPNSTRRGTDETELTEENLHPAVLASAAIPSLFPPVEIPTLAGTAFVDGGVVMNSPLRPAIDAGADVIHLICLNPDVDSIPLPPLNNTLDSFTRSLVASTASNIATDLDHAKLINSIAGLARRRRTGELYRPITVHRYHPTPGHLGGIAGLLDFSLRHVDELIAEGVAQAKNHDCGQSKCVLPGSAT